MCLKWSLIKKEKPSLHRCCNAEGNVMPPVCILKGVNKKPEWEEAMPPGSKLIMNRKSAYVKHFHRVVWNLFSLSLREKVLIILDGHTSNTSADRLLGIAADNDTKLLCFPSYTTRYLQSLDRCYFKPLKHFWYEACQHWMDTLDRPRKIGRLGQLLTSAWNNSATSKNEIR